MDLPIIRTVSIGSHHAVLLGVPSAFTKLEANGIAEFLNNPKCINVIYLSDDNQGMLLRNIPPVLEQYFEPTIYNPRSPHFENAGQVPRGPSSLRDLLFVMRYCSQAAKRAPTVSAPEPTPKVEKIQPKAAKIVPKYPITVLENGACRVNLASLTSEHLGVQQQVFDRWDNQTKISHASSIYDSLKGTYGVSSNSQTNRHYHMLTGKEHPGVIRTRPGFGITFNDPGHRFYQPHAGFESIKKPFTRGNVRRWADFSLRASILILSVFYVKISECLRFVVEPLVDYLYITYQVKIQELAVIFLAIFLSHSLGSLSLVFPTEISFPSTSPATVVTTSPTEDSNSGMEAETKAIALIGKKPTFRNLSIGPQGSFGEIDLVYAFVDYIVLVEVKRTSTPSSRKASVKQILKYASAFRHLTIKKVIAVTCVGDELRVIVVPPNVEIKDFPEPFCSLKYVENSFIRDFNSASITA